MSTLCSKSFLWNLVTTYEDAGYPWDPDVCARCKDDSPTRHWNITFTQERDEHRSQRARSLCPNLFFLQSNKLLCLIKTPGLHHRNKEAINSCIATGKKWHKRNSWAFKIEKARVLSARVSKRGEAGACWNSRVSVLQFAALTSLILSDLGKQFNDCFLTVFQHCVGGWSWTAGQGRYSDVQYSKWMFQQNNKHFSFHQPRKAPD